MHSKIQYYENLKKIYKILGTKRAPKVLEPLGVWRVGVTLKPTGPLQRLAATPSPGSNTFQEKKKSLQISLHFAKNKSFFWSSPRKNFVLFIFY
jgi:hypothetical protein